MSFHPHTCHNSHCWLPSLVPSSWKTSCIYASFGLPDLAHQTWPICEFFDIMASCAWRMGSGSREEAILQYHCQHAFPLMEAPHSKKFLVGGTQLQSNVIASSLLHYPRYQMHHSHYRKSIRGLAYKKERNMKGLPPRQQKVYLKERVSRWSVTHMCKRLLKNRNGINYCHTVSPLIALSFPHYYLIAHKTQFQRKRSGCSQNGWIFWVAFQPGSDSSRHVRF